MRKEINSVQKTIIYFINGKIQVYAVIGLPDWPVGFYRTGKASGIYLHRLYENEWVLVAIGHFYYSILKNVNEVRQSNRFCHLRRLPVLAAPCRLSRPTR